MRPAKIVAIVIGALLILVGIGVLVPGIILLSFNGSYRDSSGFLTTSDRALASSGYALITPDVNLDLGSADWIPGGGSVQIRATSSGTAPVFVGIGPTDQVTTYLNGAAYDEVTNLGFFTTSVEYRHYEGGAPPTPPGQQTFWAAKQEGSGTQTVQWDVTSGNWTAVLMNADGSAPVNASVSLGVHLGFLLPLGIGMTAFGVVLLAIGIVLVILGARRPRQPLQPGYPGGPPYAPPGGPPPGAQPPYQQPPAAAYAPPPYQSPPYQAAPPVPGETAGPPSDSAPREEA